LTNHVPTDAHQRLAAFAAHQQTMREFLKSQGEVIRRVIAVGQRALAAEPIGRFVMRARVLPIDANTASPLAGLHVITSNPADVDAANAVAAILENRGVRAAILDSSLLLDREKLIEALDVFRCEHGPVCGVIHLAGLAELAMPGDLAAWQTINETQTLGLFQLLQNCADDLSAEAGQILSFSALDGSFGREVPEWNALPTGAAVLGLLKTFAIEWPSVAVKVIDVQNPAPTALAAMVEAELTHRDGAVEIGYADGARRVFEFAEVPCAPASQTPPRWTPQKDWVVLATGGARGITAECLREVLLPGMTLVLLARSAEPGPEDAATIGKTVTGELRKHFLTAAQNLGERVTPASIDGQIAALLRGREIRNNLAEFRAGGVVVEYHRGDASSLDDVARVLDSVYSKHGRIDAVLHGAGIVEDKLIADKTSDSFARVFNTKANSIFALAHLLRPENLKCLVLFASVAGRAGNRGQCDYACANELINRMAWWIHYRWPQTKVCSINWGPWESGMASPEINRQFRERGVVPIPSLSGRAFLRAELSSSERGPVESIAGTFQAVGDSALFPVTGTHSSLSSK